MTQLILGGQHRPELTEGFAVRWGGSFNHVATDESPELETNWLIFERESLDRVYRRFYDWGVTRPLVYTVYPVVGGTESRL